MERCKLGFCLMEDDPRTFSIFESCEGAYAPRTLSGYRNDLKCFQKWCFCHSLAWLPCLPTTVADFVDHQADCHKISTIKRRVSAITFVHRMSDLPEPTNHSTVRLALRRASRSRAQRPDQVRGLTYDVLSRVLDLQPTTLADLRDTAFVNGGVKTSHVAAQKSTTSGHLERAMETG